MRRSFAPVSARSLTERWTASTPAPGPRPNRPQNRRHEKRKRPRVTPAAALLLGLTAELTAGGRPSCALTSLRCSSCARIHPCARTRPYGRRSFSRRLSCGLRRRPCGRPSWRPPSCGRRRPGPCGPPSWPALSCAPPDAPEPQVAPAPVALLLRLLRPCLLPLLPLPLLRNLRSSLRRSRRYRQIHLRHRERKGRRRTPCLLLIRESVTSARARAHSRDSRKAASTGPGELAVHTAEPCKKPARIIAQRFLGQEESAQPLSRNLRCLISPISAPRTESRARRLAGWWN